MTERVARLKPTESLCRRLWARTAEAERSSLPSGRTEHARVFFRRYVEKCDKNQVRAKPSRHHSLFTIHHSPNSRFWRLTPLTVFESPINHDVTEMILLRLPQGWHVCRALRNDRRICWDCHSFWRPSVCFAMTFDIGNMGGTAVLPSHGDGRAFLCFREKRIKNTE